MKKLPMKISTPTSFVVALFALGSATLHAVDYTWTNGATALWTATNAWSPTAPTGGPTASDNVIGTTGSNLQLNAGTYNINNFTATTTTGSTWALQSGATGASTLNVAGTFTMDSTKSVFVIRNPGASTGTLTLNAANISVVNTNGTLFLGNTGDLNSLHAVSVSGSTTVNAGTRLRMNVTNSANLGALTVNGALSLVTTTNDNISRIVSVTSLSGSGGVNGNAGSGLNSSATLIINGASTTTFSGVIANGNNGVVSLTKSGSGVQTLTGNNTFGGAVLVDGGVLALQAASGAAAGSTTGITVATNATLLVAGSNQVNDAAGITLSGGTIRRSSGVGEVFGNLNVTLASFLDFGSGAAGTLQFQNYSNTGSALVTVQNFFPGNKLQFTSTSFGTNNLSAFNFGSSQYSTGTEGSYFTITAIPEPSTYLAAAGLLALLLWPSRSRLLKDAKAVLGLRAPMRDRLQRRA